MIGEYLGEGWVLWSLAAILAELISDEENVAIMHAFVDQLDFNNIPFVDALRLFLQSFRLPGEAQKIDRYMLKFAERYIAGNAKTPFANAGRSFQTNPLTALLNSEMGRHRLCSGLFGHHAQHGCS